MPPFRYAHSTRPRWSEAARECLAALGPVPAEARLGFVYATDHFAGQMEAIVEACKARTGVGHWVGTVGMAIAATGREFLDEPALAMMLAELPETAFRILPNLNSLADLLREPEAFPVGGAPAWFGVVHGDPHNPLIAELIEHVAERTETGFLVGGLTSSRGPAEQVADRVVSGGLSGVLFSRDVAVATRLTQGVSPLGPRHAITACERNVVHTLDGRPALEVLREDLGPGLPRRPEGLGGEIFVGLPTRDTDMDDYLVRQLIGLDPRSGLIAVGDYVEQGQPLMFCRGDAASAVQDMQRMLDALGASLAAEPRGALYFSCLGRGAHLFGPDSAELGMIARSLGEIPLVGFFANGEISRNRLYGWTGVLTVFT